LSGSHCDSSPNVEKTFGSVFAWCTLRRPSRLADRPGIIDCCSEECDLQTTMGCVQGSPSRRLVPQWMSGSNTGANLSEFAGEVKMRVSRARDSGWPFKSFLNSADRLTAFFSTAECTRQLSRTLHGFPSDLTTPHCLSGSIW
jgi:hypothetical protein